MSNETYGRAVEIFEGLVSAALSGRHDNPASLIRAANLPSSSGYRHVATLEAEGFLRRDQNGTYLAGWSSVRTGLRGFHAGRIAPVAEPIVTELRQASQHSTFIGVCEEMTLFIGPHSVGREGRQHRIQRRYLLEDAPRFATSHVTEAGLRYLENDIARRVPTLITPLEYLSGKVVVLGLVLAGPRSDPVGLSRLLKDAVQQIEYLGELNR